VGDAISPRWFEREDSALSGSLDMPEKPLLRPVEFILPFCAAKNVACRNKLVFVIWLLALTGGFTQFVSPGEF